MSEPAEREAMRSIAVVGGGIVARSAALAFARALPKVRVILVETPLDPAALADRLPSTLPAVGRFHAAIGVDELALVKAGVATHRLGTRFERWSASGESWVHAFGSTGDPVGGVPFHKAWLRTRAGGGAAQFDRHNPAAVVAAAGKFVHPDQDGKSPLSTYLYALRLDVAGYADLLAAACDRSRIERIAGALVDCALRADGGLAAILLADGRRIEADLFVDCAGPSAPLLTAIGGGAFEDWSQWLPCDRLRFGESKGGRADPLDVVEAHPEGWRWTSPLPDRLLTGFAWNSAITGDARAAKLFDGGGIVPIRPGRRPAPWRSNVLALGDAAIAVDPLEGAGLHLAQSAILRAIELMPGRDCNPLELAEYNRRTAWETLRVRDFIAVHYLCSGRSGGPFWKALAGREPPETLARTLEQWQRRGRLPFFEEESFDAESWIATLVGLGVLPRDVDPSAQAVPADRAAAAIEAYRGRLEALPERLPSYADYLGRMRGADGRRP